MIASGAPSSGPQLLAILNAMEEYEARFGITPRDVAFMSNVSTVRNLFYLRRNRHV